MEKLEYFEYIKQQKDKNHETPTLKLEISDNPVVNDLIETTIFPFRLLADVLLTGICSSVPCCSSVPVVAQYRGQQLSATTEQ